MMQKPKRRMVGSQTPNSKTDEACGAHSGTHDAFVFAALRLTFYCLRGAGGSRRIFGSLGGESAYILMLLTRAVISSERGLLWSVLFR